MTGVFGHVRLSLYLLLQANVVGTVIHMSAPGCVCGFIKNFYSTREGGGLEGVTGWVGGGYMGIEHLKAERGHAFITDEILRHVFAVFWTLVVQ